MRMPPMLSASLLAATVTGPAHAVLSHQRCQDDEWQQLPDWDAIVPSYELEYTSCFCNGVKCARLLVPMDWSKHNTSCTANIRDDEDTVAIAIAVLPATVPRSDPSFGGTVLVNPGGPGGPTTDMLWWYEDYQNMMDGDKHFEILAFDVRGVGDTTPRAQCFDEDWQRRMWTIQKRGSGVIDSSDATFAVHYEHERAHGMLCDMKNPGNIHAHMGSASVARDMLHIVDKVDEELRRDNSTALARRREETDKPKLQYAGISYGSALGNYFASMFPGRVGRMFVEAVVDTNDYRVGAGKRNLMDTEAAIDHLWEACFERECAVRLPSDQGPADIKRRVNALLEDLDANPRSAYRDGEIYMVRSEGIRSDIRVMAYNPDVPYFFELYMGWLAEYLAGDFSMLLRRSLWPEDIEMEGREYIDMDEPGAIIRGLDAINHAPERNLTWAKDVYETMKEQSPLAAQSWIFWALRGVGSEMKPAYDFYGDFGSPAPDPEADDAPDAPLLIINSRIDPVTPLENAFAMSSQHANSSVVIAEVSGHQAFMRSTECLQDIVRRYFNDGTVPQNGTTCEPRPYNRDDWPRWDDEEGEGGLERRNRMRHYKRRVPHFL